jgi:chaperone modulatory protein CbpM
MMHIASVVALFREPPEAQLTATELAAWIERGWVRPEKADTDPIFSDIDVARVRLIYDLRMSMRIEDETIPMILSLLDQVYDLRACLRSVLRAVEAQPQPVRESIRAAIG